MPSRRDALLVIVGAACILFFTHVISPVSNQETVFGINNPLVSHPVDDLRDLPTRPPTAQSIPTSSAHYSPPQAPAGAKAFSIAPGSTNNLPETRVVQHAPGWTIFENLYMSGGTLFALSSRGAEGFPEPRMMTSTGLPAENTPENIAMREPTRDNFDFVRPVEAAAKWAGGVWGVEGTTFLFNDPAQFIAHYYHGCAELIFGTWSFYAGVYDGNVTARGVTTAPPVNRAIFAHADTKDWRDGSRFNAYFLYSAFPSISIEGQEDWRDRTYMTRGRDKAWLFERVLLSDRSASFRGQYCGSQTQRTASEAYEAVRARASRWWWEPVRRSVLRFAGVSAETLDLALRWPPVRKAGEVAITQVPPVVITYISRQGTDRRRLIDADHQGLVRALESLCHRRGWELVVADAGSMAQEEQLKLAARTTIMIGVHGNGLTHLLLMPPTRVSAVIEIFTPQGFAHDYEWTTRALNMKHFAVWNDTWHSHPTEPRVDYPDSFQGDRIPVHGPAVAEIVEQRIDGKLT